MATDPTPCHAVTRCDPLPPLARSARKTPTDPDAPSSCCSSLGYINPTTKSSASSGWISNVTSPSSTKKIKSMRIIVRFRF